MTTADLTGSMRSSDALVTEVPEPVLQAVHNCTPFKHLQFDKMGPGRRFYDVVILCASYDLQPGAMPLSKTQRGPVLADEFWDEDHAIVSSLKLAGDVLLAKPGTDVFLTGTARTLNGQPQYWWDCALGVRRAEQSLFFKVLRLTGPRFWQLKLFGSGWTLRKPLLTTEVALRYELAYGGHWTHPRERDPDLALGFCEFNPSGSGHFGPSHEETRAYPGPQIERVTEPITSSGRRIQPAGFGPVARFWQPRAALQGTYDDAWMKQFQRSAIPDYSADFDLRYFQCAPADQVVPGFLWGHEQIELAGLFPETQTMMADLPGLWIHAWAMTGDSQVLHDYMKLDTVHIDLDTRQVHLTWRLTLDQDKDIRTVMLESKPLVQPETGSAVSPIHIVRNIHGH